MRPGDLYRSCKVSAYRLETLQHYTVPGDEDRQRAFQAGRPLPPPRPEKQETIDLVSSLVAAGRQIGRVHVVTWPLSDYVRYEFSVYAENVAAGEDVRIADAGEHPELADLVMDFAIFDAETSSPSLITFDYSAGGALAGYEHETDPAMIDRCWVQYQLARERSVSLREFLAAHNTSPAR